MLTTQSYLMKLQFPILAATALTMILACGKSKEDIPQNEGLQFTQVQDGVLLSWGQNAQKAYVQGLVSRTNPSEMVKSVDSIHFSSHESTSYMVAYYHSNLGHSNVALETTYATDSADTQSRIIKCEGTCGCLVEVIITRSVDIHCTCQNCAMISY